MPSWKDGWLLVLTWGMIDTAGTSNVPQTVLKAVGFPFLRQQPNGISLQKSIQKKGKKNKLAHSLV
jgi:hypothetical protein